MAENTEVIAGEFKIVVAEKRTIKNSCAGQVVEVLKRAKSPLTLVQISSRVKNSKVGKGLTVKDVKVRCLVVLEWHAKHSGFMAEEGNGWVLTRV